MQTLFKITIMVFAIIAPQPGVADLLRGNGVWGRWLIDLLTESMRRAVGRKKGCLKQFKESPKDARPILMFLNTL